MMKSIRPFVSFDYDLRTTDIKRGGISPQSKAKIRRYYREISAATKPPHFIYRPRKKAHLKAAIKKAGIEPQFTQIKAVPIASTEKSPLRWIDKKGNFVLQEQYIKTVFVPLDPLAVIADPKEYARRIIRENPNAETYHIKVGNNFLPTVFTKRTFVKGFTRFLRRYKGKALKHFVKDVLAGFDLSAPKEQSTYMEWQAIQKRTPKKSGRKPKGYKSHK